MSGILPESWQWKSLRELATINYGKSAATVLSEDGEIPVVGTGGVERYGSDYLYDGESIILGRKGSIDKVAFAVGKFWTIDTAYFLSEFKHQTDVRWLYYFLQTVDLRSLNEATGVPSLSRDLLYELAVPTPPPREQTKIAELLSTLDQAIEQTEALMGKQHRIKTGLMQDLFSKGIDAHGNIRSEATHAFKDSLLGRIPVEWQVVPLQECSDVIDSLHRTPGFVADGYPMVRVVDINGGMLSLTKCERVETPVYEEFTRNHKPKRGDIVMSRVGTYGVSSYVETDEEFCIGQNTVVITGYSNPLFLFEFLQTKVVREHFETNLAGSSQKTLSLKAIRETPVPVLTDEASRIASVLETEGRIIVRYRDQLEKQRLIRVALMRDLLTGKRRVTSLL
jgi:type I restriction enzyme S subunit